MFVRVPLILTIILIITACTEKPHECEKLIWKKNPSFVLSKDELKNEIDVKMKRVKNFLNENELDGILLTQVRNFYWITAGIANNQIVLNKDVGAASLLIMKDGKKYLICAGSEAGRLMEETLGELGYELKQYNWYEANLVKDLRGNIIRDLAGIRKIASDIPFPNTVLVADKFKELRYSLTVTEIKRYRWLGREVTEAVCEICRKVKPGMDEYKIEAMIAAEIRSRGIIPTVLLIGVDERIYNYRHALPGGAKLKNYAMINVVAEKWGMPIAVTRFVHFGPLPDELKNKLEKTAIINAHFEEATKNGVTGGQIFEKCKEWYAEVGFDGEWQKHHQGGAIGYDDREWVIYPGNKERIHNRQAFAWNPTITGAKVENTIISYENSIDVITECDNWPMIIVELNGKQYHQPGILIRDENTLEPVDQPDYTIQL